MAKGLCLRCGRPAESTFCQSCSSDTLQSLQDIYWTPERIKARQEHEKGGKS
jgi:NMD protein affecting ribosome stability and mRNA decay